jgi:hypothetical protein
MIHIKDAEDRAALKEREARESMLRVEAKNTTSLASVHEDAEGLVRKIPLLECELAEAHWAREVAEENSHGLSDLSADAEQRREVSERECGEQFEELTLLRTRGSELYLAIVGPPWLRNHLTKGMWIAALRHTKMAGELAGLQSAVTFATEFALRRSADKTFRVEVVEEQVAKF